MEITYRKHYTEQKFEHFTLYQNLSFASTNVFWEYYNLIKDNSDATKDEIIELVKNHKKIAKSKLRISYDGIRLEFFKKINIYFLNFI